MIGCIKRAVEDALEGAPLDEEEKRCLEELGLYRDGLLAPRPYIVFKALEAGASLDLSRISRRLSWREFEEIILYLLEGWGFSTLRNVRLECGGRWAEFDVMARSDKYLIVIEAKRWKYGGGKWGEVVQEHLEKVERCLPRLRLLAPKVIPLVVTLTSFNAVVKGVPVLSISFLVDFLRNIDNLGDQILVLT